MPASRIVFFGNCQAQALAGIYGRHAAPALGQEVAWIDAWDPDRMAEWTCLLAKADLVVSQVTSGPTPVLLDEDGLRVGAKRVRFPDIRGIFLWPYGGEERVDNPSMPFKTSGPYNPEVGDAFLNRLVRERVPPEEALQRYLDLDLPRITHLDRLFEIVLDQQRQKDAATGIAIADHIELNFRTEPMFGTPGHLSAGLFKVLARQVYGLMGVTSAPVEQILGYVRAAPFEEYHEAPIHPATIAHYGLTFVDAETGYHHLQEGRFDFSERVLRYMRCEWSPELHEGRFLCDDPNAAHALALIERGLARAPRSAYGYRWLGYVLGRLGRNEEAMEALRRAVEIEPDDPVYRADFEMRLRSI